MYVGGGRQNLIEKILVAHDGSEPAGRALSFALDLAEKYSAEIVLLSVFQPAIAPVFYNPSSVGPQPIPPVTMDNYADELKLRHERILLEGLKQAQKASPNLKVSTQLLEGRPSDRIIEAAKEGKIDLIVMGSRGLGGIKEFFLGSVSDRVANGATCPVLIVK